MLQNLPTVSIFQGMPVISSTTATIDMWASGLHFDTATNRKRVRLFWAAFAVMFIYEIIPSYIFPLLNGFSIFCLASQHTSPGVQNVITNVFGGADGNE